VTEFDPEATTELSGPETPRFPVVMRGYDRYQVDRHFADLTIQLERERQRANEVETRLAEARSELRGLENQAPPSFVHLGAEAAKLLEQAGESADQMLRGAREQSEKTQSEAKQRASAILEDAERRAAELEGSSSSIIERAEADAERVRSEALQLAERERTAAEQEARTVLAEARDATNTVWQEAQRERVAVEAEIERLDQLRREVLGQLHSVRSQLTLVLDDADLVLDEDEDEEAELDDEAFDDDDEIVLDAEVMDDDEDVPAPLPTNERRLLREGARASLPPRN
jgi:cell division septum initiation protein DivIVA